MLDKAFEKFIDKAPVAVMVRGVLERVLNPDALDAIYERAAVRQYTRELLFSSVVGLMHLVVCRIQPSIHAAYQENRKAIATSVTSVYNKLNGIDTETSRALVKETAEQLGESVYAMKGSCEPWLAGYRVKVLDGNCIEATHHRIAQLRGIGAGALPGKSLVIYEPELEMATDVFPCADGHAQERSLLSAVLPTVAPKDVLIVDRNFCVRVFLHGIAARDAYVVCRQHQGLPWQPDGEERLVGLSESGTLFEQAILVSDCDGHSRGYGVSS